MRALLFLTLKFYFTALYYCADFDSEWYICIIIGFLTTFSKRPTVLFLTGYEINQLEVTPIYDIILFNDIADVIKDFDNDLVNM